MSKPLRWGAAAGALLLLVLLLWLSLRGARHASLSRAPRALPARSAAPPPPPATAAARSRRATGPGVGGGGDSTHAAPAGADDLMPHEGAAPPKDPNGPVRDWRDFTPDERAAVSGMELDMADMGDVIERLESGEEIARLRDAPVTADEQAAMRAEIDAYAAVYEDAYDRAYQNETTVIEMADAMQQARARFDQRVRDIYGLSDDQFYALFPYRRELGGGGGDVPQ